MSRWSVSFEFTFCKGKTRFTHVIAVTKRANSHNFEITNLNFLTITFVAIYLLNRGKSSLINKSSTRVNNTFRKIIFCFWRKHCNDSPYQTSSVVLFKVNSRCLFLRALYSTGVRLWQILVKIMFQSLFGSLLNHLYHYTNENASL